jgi:hypothetical protein
LHLDPEKSFYFIFTLLSFYLLTERSRAQLGRPESSEGEIGPAASGGTRAGVGQHAPTKGHSSDRGSMRKLGHKQQLLHAAGSGNGELQQRREPEKVGSGCGGWLGSQRGGELERRVAWRWQMLQLRALLTGSHGGLALERWSRAEGRWRMAER